MFSAAWKMLKDTVLAFINDEALSPFFVSDVTSLAYSRLPQGTEPAHLEGARASAAPLSAIQAELSELEAMPYPHHRPVGADQCAHRHANPTLRLSSTTLAPWRSVIVSPGQCRQAAA
jgi:hypothetical protein